VIGKCATGWLWVLGSGGEVILEFTPVAAKICPGPARRLKGYLQPRRLRRVRSTGQRGGQSAANPGGCWAHARRKFVEALEDNQRATAVSTSAKIYMVERHARDEEFSHQRAMIRQKNLTAGANRLRPMMQGVPGKKSCRKVLWAKRAHIAWLKGKP